MFLPESTSLAVYSQSLQKLCELSNLYDGIVAAHVPVILPNDLIDRLIRCAENIDLGRRSILQRSPFIR
jgi:hypothetical protein